ncbi:MAG: hypothetical protein Q9213_007253 [Squamulea squamosa]
MEVISGAASVTQLAAYSHQVFQRLVQLRKAVQEGPDFCRTQRFNIGFLLESLRRISISQTSDAEIILPLLISTANIATSLLGLLEPRGSLCNHWLWVSKGQKIESAFRALNDKARLLQLHITERIYHAVTHVHKDIQTMSQKRSQSVSHSGQLVCMYHPSNPRYPLLTILGSKDSPTSDLSNLRKDTMSNASAAPTSVHTHSVSMLATYGQGHVDIGACENKASDNAKQSVANGWGKRAASANVNANKNEAHNDAEQDVANEETIARHEKSRGEKCAIS